MTKSRVFFVGRFPAEKEVGGVTSFTYTFAEKYYKHNIVFIDFYPALNKIIPKFSKVALFRGGIVRRVVRLSTFTIKNKASFFFNFSSINALFLILLLPKRKTAKWFVLLHNGGLDAQYLSAGRFRRYILKIAAKKVDCFGAISLSQSDFYRKVNAKEVKMVTPYIASNSQLNKAYKQPLKKFLISGFPTKIYRIIETLRVFELLWESGCRFTVIVCLYGYDSDGIENKILGYIDTLSFVTLYRHIDFIEFSKILSHTDVYIRMNSVDSFGLVIAEAINKGVHVVTTDVCQRYEGANLLNMDDFEALQFECIRYLKTGAFSGQMRVSRPEFITEDYGDIIHSLSQI